MADDHPPLEVPPLETISSTDLFGLDLAPPVMIAPGYISTGLNILGANPKVGKSWLALQLAHAVATGGYFLGAKTVQGRAIYLALEDTLFRLKHRMQGIHLEPTPMLEFATESLTLARGGFEAIHDLVHERGDVKLVIVDTLARVKDVAVGKGNAYEADSQLGGALQKLAFTDEIAFVVVHHMSKAGNKDFLLSLSGSAGLPGAADVVLGMERTRNKHEVKLMMTGRDIEEKSLDLEWTRSGWQLVRPLPPDYGRYN